MSGVGRRDGAAGIEIEPSRVRGVIAATTAKVRLALLGGTVAFVCATSTIAQDWPAGPTENLPYQLALYVGWAEACAAEDDLAGTDLDEAYALVDTYQTSLTDYAARAAFDRRYATELKSVRHIMSVKAAQGERLDFTSGDGTPTACRTVIAFTGEMMLLMVHDAMEMR